MSTVNEYPDGTFFDVNAILRNGTSMKVSRRYSDFLALSEGLRAGTLLHQADFPRKHLFRCSGSKLVARKQKLLMWLHDVLQTPASLPARNLLGDFFGLTQERLTPEEVRAPINHMALSPPSAPAQHLPETEGIELQIEVPVGVKHGQCLEFCLLDGTKLTVAVPESLAGGSTWCPWYDSSTGNLTSLPNAVDQEESSVPNAVDQKVDQKDEQTESGMLLEITIPQGLASGERVAVTVPDGRLMTVNVPSDAVEGAFLRLWFEPLLGSLTVLGMKARA